MNTTQAAALKHAPARASRDPDEASAAEESLLHHAERLMRARLSAMARRVLDPSIALLQRLRELAGGAQDADAEAGDDRSRPRNARPGGVREAAAHANEGEGEAGAPRPKRRLLTYLIYLSVLLAGGMVGGALAYELLAKLLYRQTTEIQRVQAALSKQTKSVASNQKKFTEAQTKRTEAEKMLEEAQKKQVEEEKKLEAVLKDSKVAAEKQKTLDEAVKLLESIRAADRLTTAPRSPLVGSGNTELRLRSPKSGDCTLAGRGVNALKDCVEEFNR